jgi:Cu-Zn family superoxide dismutase
MNAILRISTILAITALGMPVASAQEVTAVAHIEDAKGKEIGVVEFRQTASKGLWLNVSIGEGPPGNHAFHIHETGKCEGDFGSAGGHFAPGSKKHGALVEGGAHAGDLPNLHIPQNGRLNVEIFARDVSLTDGPNSLLDEDGSAIVMHSGIDDYKSQPSGNAGARIGCGVVAGEALDKN